MRLFLTIATALTLSAGAASAADQCFRTRDMRGHKVVDDRSMNIAVGIRDVYRIESKGRCFTTGDNTDSLLIEPIGGSDLICRALDLNLSVNRSGFIAPCIIDKITKLTPEQVAAIPRGQKP